MLVVFQLMWVMKEYGVAESWTKKSVPIDSNACLLAFTFNGELLIEKACNIHSLDPKSLNEETLRIPMPRG